MPHTAQDRPNQGSQQRRRAIRNKRRAVHLGLILIISAAATLAFLRVHQLLSPDWYPQPSDWLSSPQDGSSDFYDTMSHHSDLNTFLRHVKQSAIAHLEGEDSRPLVLVMGNGAGDLDSLTSAISLSYMLAQLPHSGLPLSETSLPADAIFAPLIQTNRSDVHLRPENVAILAATGVDQRDLLLLSDLTDTRSSGGLELDLAASEQLGPKHNTFLGLVDHPQLELPWTQHGEAPNRHVLFLVDHHADAGQHMNAAMRVFREPEGTKNPSPTGSAQSIVVELFSAAVAQSPNSIPQALADLAISTILIDTDNLRPAPKGRASKTDFSAIETLIPLSSLAAPETAQRLRTALLEHSPADVARSSDLVAFQPEAIADTSLPVSHKTASIASILAASKNAISHLASVDLLKRDYKSSSLSSSALGPAADSLLCDSSGDLKAGFSSVNLGLVPWLHRGEGMGTSNQVESKKAWQAFWSSLDEWMSSQQLQVAVVGTSFRDEESDKHRRELLLAWRSKATDASTVAAASDRFFSKLKEELESRDSPLELNTPWKGARLASTGKRERASGIDDTTGRLLEVPSGHPTWAQVWRQGNARANRKVYMPTILAAVQKAANSI